LKTFAQQGSVRQPASSAEEPEQHVPLYVASADQPYNHRREEIGHAAVLTLGRTRLTPRSSFHSPRVEIIPDLAAAAYHCGGQF
jgi:hypothetical protein